MPRRGGRHGVTPGANVNAMTVVIKAALNMTCWNEAMVLTHTGRERLDAPHAMLIMHGSCHRGFSMS
eukprot:6068031-Karenia_brevis.AAC.1